MADPVSYDQMRELLREQATMIRGGGGAGGGGGGASGGGFSGGAVVGAASGVIDVFGKLATGTASAKDMLGVATNVISSFGGAGQIAGKALGTFGGAVLDVNNTLKETGKYGVSFGQNLGEANKAILQAQLTMPEFQDMVRSSGKSFAGLAGGQNESAKAFLGLAKEMQGTTVAQDLKAAGMSSQELNESLLLTSRNSFRVNMEDAASRKEAVSAALSMANEMNKVADLTGKSRKQQEDEIRRIQERADIEAAVLLKQKTDPNFGKNMDAATQALSRFGPKVQELLAEEATGGARSEDAIKTKAALGTAAEAVAEYGRALESGNAERIAEAKKAAETAIAERVGSEEFLKAAKVTQGNVLNMGDLVHGSFQYQKNLAAEQEELAKQGKTATKEAAEASLAAKAEARARGEKIDEKGKPVKDEGAVLGRTINQMENLGKVVGGTMAEGFNTLNKSLGSTVSSALPSFEAKLKQIAAGPGALTASAQKLIDDAAKAVGVKTATPATAKKATEMVQMGPDAVKAMADATGKAVKETPKPEAPKAETKPPVAAPAPAPAPKAETKTETKTVVKETVKAEAPKPEVKPEPKVEAKPVVAPVPAPVPKVEPKVEVKPEVKVEPKVEPKVEVKPTPAPVQPTVIPKPEPAQSTKKTEGQAAAAEGVTKPLDAIATRFESLKSMFMPTSEAKIEPMMSAVDELKKAKIEPPEAPKGITSDDLIDIFGKMTASKGAELDSKTMTEMKEQLTQLNSIMQQVATHTAEVADMSGKQVRATKGLSGNRLAV